MLSFKWQPLLLLPTLLLLSTFFSPSHEASLHAPTRRLNGAVNDNEYEWRTRSLLQETNGAVQSSSMILAANRTHRKDPSNGLRYYTGGWNISNAHYVWSLWYSAEAPISVAIAWLVGFGVFLFISCICHCCCGGKRYGYSQIAYVVSLIFLSILAIIVVAGSGVLFKGQERFHTRATKTLYYIMEQANSTSEKLKVIQTELASAKQVAVDQKLTLPPDVQANVDKVLQEINSSVVLLDKKKEEIPRKLEKIVDPVILALIIIAAAMLVFIIFGFLFSYLGMQCVVYIFILFGWVIVGGLFILCAVFLVFHNVVGDTCVAMDQWVQNPTAHTALDDLLSCPDNATSQNALTTAKNVTFKLVSDVNQFIALAGNADIPPNTPPGAGGALNYNQSGPLMPLVCAPYNADLTDRKCDPKEVELANATQVYGTFVCQASSTGTCTSQGRMTPQIYEQVSLATNVSYTLHYYGPFLVDLMDCSFVRETFSLISKDHCPGLSRHSYHIYIGLIMVSTGVMLSLIFWMPHVRERRLRSKYKPSKVPNPTARNL